MSEEADRKDVHPWSLMLVACAERIAQRFADRWGDEGRDPYQSRLHNTLFWVDAFLLTVRASLLAGAVLTLAYRIPILFVVALVLTVMVLAELVKWI